MTLLALTTQEFNAQITINQCDLFGVDLTRLVFIYLPDNGDFSQIVEFSAFTLPELITQLYEFGIEIDDTPTDDSPMIVDDTRHDATDPAQVELDHALANLINEAAHTLAVHRASGFNIRRGIETTAKGAINLVFYHQGYGGALPFLGRDMRKVYSDLSKAQQFAVHIQIESIATGGK